MKQSHIPMTATALHKLMRDNDARQELELLIQRHGATEILNRVNAHDKLVTALGELLIALDQNAGALYGNDEAWGHARAVLEVSP
jgi:hypothetical protein